MNAQPKNPDDWSDLDDTSFVPTGKTARELDRAYLDPAAGISLGTRRSSETNRNQVAQFDCGDCKGTGTFSWWKRTPWGPERQQGPCRKCKGTGKLKTDPVACAKRKQAREQIVRQRAEAAIATYIEAHRPEYDWVVSKGLSFGFARSMVEALNKYSEWTEKQLAAIRKCMEQDKQREVQRAAQAAAAPVVTGAGFERMVKAFASAKASGLKYPKFHAADLTFSVPGPMSKYKDGFFVKEGSTYLGRIDAAGKWFPVGTTTAEQAERVKTVCADPLAAAVLHGKQTGRCSCCGRELENEESVRLGIGPICRGKWGL